MKPPSSISVTMDVLKTTWIKELSTARNSKAPKIMAILLLSKWSAKTDGAYT